MNEKVCVADIVSLADFSLDAIQNSMFRVPTLRCAASLEARARVPAVEYYERKHAGRCACQTGDLAARVVSIGLELELLD